MSKRGAKEERKTLEEIAAEHGYTPGEFSVVRITEDIRFIKECRDYLRVRRIPPGLAFTDMTEFERWLNRKTQEVFERENAILNYFHPKQRSVEQTVQGPDGGGVQVIISDD